MKASVKLPSPKSRSRFSPVAVERPASTYQKTVLANGARVISERIPHVRSVSVGIWIDTGSRDESPALGGISHFIEHMVFKGTRKRTVKEIARSIESVGGYLNAFTGKENTCYYARVLDEHVDLAVDVLADMVLSATFAEKDLEKEKGVVIEELKTAEDDPDDIIHDYFERSLFGDHPMGSPVIGTEKSLRALRRSDLVGYRDSHYIPRKIILTAAGNIDHPELVRLAEKYLRSKTGGAADPRPRLKPREQKAVRDVKKRPIQQAHVLLGTVGLGARNQQRYALNVMNSLLGDGMSSRLFQNIRERYGFAYSVYSFANLLSDTGSFGAYCGTDAAHVDRCIDLIWNEFHRLATRPVPKAELHRTKEQLKGSMMLGLESIPNRMIRLGTSELYYGQLTGLDSIIRRIEAVTQDDILNLAKDLLREERFHTVLIQPNGLHIPSGT